jgi:hypothetical protein
LTQIQTVTFNSYGAILDFVRAGQFNSELVEIVGPAGNGTMTAIVEAANKLKLTVFVIDCARIVEMIDTRSAIDSLNKTASTAGVKITWVVYRDLIETTRENQLFLLTQTSFTGNERRFITGKKAGDWSTLGE